VSFRVMVKIKRGIVFLLNNLETLYISSCCLSRAYTFLFYLLIA
jgi:hypothetical protein